MRHVTTHSVPGLLAAALVALLAAPLGAQEEETSPIAEIIRVDVAPDQQAAFEEGAQQHIEILVEAGLEEAWHAWEVITGKHAGSYYVGTFGHAWADFDEMGLDDPEAAQQSARENLDPYVEARSPGFWRVRPELSHANPEAGEGPAMLSSVSFYHVKMGKAEAFTNAVRQVTEAAEEADYTDNYWTVHQLEYGGGPVWAITSGADSWADLADPETSLGELLEGAVGEDEAEQVFDDFTEAVAHYRTELLRYREDLSHVPEAGGQ